MSVTAERPAKQKSDRTDVGGRPVHPCHTLTEALLEAIAGIDCDVEAMEHAARAQVAIAKALHQRAMRAKDVVRAEIVAAVGVAERFCAATTGARV